MRFRGSMERCQRRVSDTRGGRGEKRGWFHGKERERGKAKPKTMGITFVRVRNVVNVQPKNSTIQSAEPGSQQNTPTKYATCKLNAAAIQRGQLFHVILTYGRVPKQVGCEGAGNDGDEGEGAMA